MTQEIKEEDLNKIKQYLKVEDKELSTNDAVDNVKELVIARLCKVIGITFAYNYRSKYFRLFANVVGEAICRMFDIRLVVGEPMVRLVRYNHINLVDKALEILRNRSVF